MKICSKCKEEKEESLFGKDSRLKSGLRASCKVCHRKASDAWMKNNLERCIENRKKYAIKNREKICEKAKKYHKSMTLEMKAKKNEYVKKYHEENKAELREKKRIAWLNRSDEQKKIDLEKYQIYYENNKDKVKKRVYEYYKSKSQERRKNDTLRTKKWREQNREKANAWSAVGNALIRGDLVKPTCCETCGVCNMRIHAHHEDYSQPLQVQWLCHECHMNLHAKKRKNEIIKGD